MQQILDHIVSSLTICRSFDTWERIITIIMTINNHYYHSLVKAEISVILLIIVLLVDHFVLSWRIIMC